MLETVARTTAYRKIIYKQVLFIFDHTSMIFAHIRATNPGVMGDTSPPIFDPHPPIIAQTSLQSYWIAFDTHIPITFTIAIMTDMVYKKSVRRQILNFISSRHGNFLQYCNLKYKILNLSIAF